MTPESIMQRLKEIGDYCEAEDVDEIEQVLLASIFAMLSLRTTDVEWEEIKKQIFYKRS